MACACHGKNGRGAPVFSQNAAMILGYGGIILGALCLWDAYERRGRRRPFLTKFLPGE
ncbi:hypothetical protein JHN55_07645 [Streptomyces sp. MBT56]|uniref:hypothetical protein n=1 Tax=Streptomyces sp. MBT56 TaxID=1488387 RepID=UPI00190C1C25|nr:hypothetical protein [Streptomyces sp. MBT56]MBK3556407.1 hypothetical protein [Streptomyces sp. MBT56]